MKELLYEIDNLLMKLEDYTHGKDGDEITAIRHKIVEALRQNNVSGSLPFNPDERLKKEEQKNEQAARNLGMTLNEGYKAGFANGWVTTIKPKRKIKKKEKSFFEGWDKVIKNL